jgi:tRNA 2-thiouridine synthesizing protein A
MGDQNKPDKQLDCVGLFCPEPVFRTRKEIDQLAVGEVLELIADDPAAEEDIPRLVKNLGLELLEMFKEDDEIHFLIKKTK